MKSNRTIETTLVFICIALWGLLLRPLFDPTPSRAQALPSAAAIQPPTIVEATEGIPYMVVANGQVSIWWVNEVSDAKPPKPGETQDDAVHAIEQNTKLFQSDAQPLPPR